MGDLSQHFSKAEFRCKDGSEHFIDRHLIEILESVRAHFGAPVHIISGYRSPAWNTRVGGAKDSYHLRGMAADFHVEGHQPSEVYSWIDYQYTVCGLGLYKSWVHVDSRAAHARWKGPGV